MILLAVSCLGANTECSGGECAPGWRGEDGLPEDEVFLSISLLTHPPKLCPTFLIQDVGVAPLLSYDSSHTGHLNWGRKWNGFNTHFSAKGLGSFRRWQEAYGKGSVGKSCPELNHSGSGSSQITTHCWPGTKWAEMALMVGDQNYPPFLKMTFCSPAPHIHINYYINGLLWGEK